MTVPARYGTAVTRPDGEVVVQTRLGAAALLRRRCA